MENGKIVIYQAQSGEPEIQVTFEHESLWLSQKAMAELFDKDSDTIGLHIKNIYTEGELEEMATTEKSSVVQQEGKRKVKRTVTHYNLDVILSVGYRVSSKRGTQFRIWANNWIGNISKKALQGAGKIGVGVGSALLAAWIKNYYGIK